MKPEPVPTYNTVEELRAELDKRRPYVLAISRAFLAGDLEACAAAQKAMREVFRS